MCGKVEEPSWNVKLLDMNLNAFTSFDMILNAPARLLAGFP